MEKEDLNIRRIESLSSKEKIEYFENIREHCLEIKKKISNGTTLVRDIVCAIYPPIVRRYRYETQGTNNIPDDGKMIFLCNHSNSHDFFTPLEVLREIGLESTVFVASDDLNKSTQLLFAGCNAVLADRNSKESTTEGILQFCSKMQGAKGVTGVVYGESTWNLHPFRLMQNIKVGTVLMAAITGYPIIPTIIEYVERDGIIAREKDLYSKCIVKFGKPFYVDRNRSLIEQTMELQQIMINIRGSLKESCGTLKGSLADVDPNIYLNHTYLKKFDGFGFTYDSESEAKFLLSHDGSPVDNEYRLNDNGILVPGVTSKSEGMRFLPKK